MGYPLGHHQVTDWSPSKTKLNNIRLKLKNVKAAGTRNDTDTISYLALD
jgi:hypothetical protein